MDEQSLHILVVEDNPTDVFLLKKALEEVQSFKIVLTQARRLDEALNFLQNESFDVVLLDLGLPDSQGLETFNRLQRDHSDNAILILSGLDNESLSVQAVQDGAQDFLVKGAVSGKNIARTIRYAIERKRSEQRMLASEAGYRRLFETARDGLLLIDADSGQITDCNPCLEEMLGFTRAEFIGKQLWEIVPFRDPEANRAAFRTLEEKGTIRYDDLPLATRSGRYIAAEFVSNLYAVGSQQIIQCNIRDITERKRAETAEMDLQRFLQATLDALPAHLAVLDENGQIIAVNRAWREFSEQNEGTAASCGVGANYIEVCQKASLHCVEEGSEVGQGIQEVLTGQREAFCLEYPCHSPTEERWFNVCVTPFASAGPTRVVVAHENITTRAKAEKLVNTSEANLAKSQQMAHLGSWELDLSNLEDINSNPLRWSDEIFRILGYAPGEFEPSNEAFFRAVHPDDRARLSRMMAEALMGGEPYSTEHRIILPDGRERIVQAQSEIIYSEENGQPLKMIGLGQDITERKLAEATLLESEARFRTAISEAPVPIMIHREDGKVLQISKGWTKYSGYDLEDVPTIRDWAERAYGEASAGAQDYIKSLYQIEETRSEGEWTITAKNGQKRVWDFITTPLGTFEDNQRVVINTAFDITESQQAKQALETTTKEIVATWESMTDAFFSLDTEWRFTHVNSKAALLWQRNAEELIGTNIWEELPGVVDTKVDTELHRAMQQQVSVDFEAFNPVRNCWREAHAYPSPVGLSVYFRDITERKQAENSLRESQARFQTFMDNSPAVAFIMDEQSRFVYVNQPFEKEMGVKLSAKSDLSVFDVWSEEIAQVMHEQNMSVLAGNRFVPLTMAIPDAGGEVQHWATWKFLLLDAAGRRLVGGLSLNVSEEERTALALRESEERFQSIVANVPGMVYQYVMRPDGSLEMPFVSQGCLDIYETDAQTLRNDPIWPSDQVHPDDRAAHDRSIAISAETFAPWRWEYRIRLESGKIKWLQGAARPQRLPDGGILWDGLITDISAYKKAEAERDRFFTLSLDMLAIIGSDGYFKRLNSAFEATLGYSDAEFMAVPFIDFVHPDDRAATLQQEARLASGSQVMRFENRYRCRDGSYKWLLWMCAPFEDLFYCVAHDVTGVKQAEALLQQANDELEMRVMERTAEVGAANESLRVENLQHQLTMATLREVAEALRQAKEEADAANAAKSEFLSRMSHELRTPLNAILGFGQILEMGELSPRSKEGVGHILKGGRHLLDLINEVLDISRVEAGHLELSLEPIALDDVVPEACALVRILAAERQIQIEFDQITAQMGQCYVLADRQRLKQVLINLLANAIKYNREGGEVKVSCRQIPGGWTCIDVSDTGPGISPQDLPKLFSPFERLGAANSSIEGTGLGLVLSQRLVTAMGGTLKVESMLGRGTTMTIALPQTAAPEKHLTNLPRANEAGGSSTLDGGEPAPPTCSVLCIEDNPSNLRLVESIFESRPEISLLTAMQGSIGLDMARQHQPDLILLDLDLPDIHGSEVLIRLQQSPRTKDIPVVIVSADATPNQVERLLNAGARNYLTKPLDVSQFLLVVDGFL